MNSYVEKKYKECGSTTLSSTILKMTDNYRIRKLTPKECWRIMGFTDEQFNRINGISNTQLYKQAGNSIVVNVIEAVFRELFKSVEI